MVSGMHIEPVERNEWIELAGRFKDYNYQQTWDYGVALAERRGARSEHIAIKSNGEVIGLADVRVKELPFLKGGIAYIAGGPLTRRNEPGDLDRLSLVLAALKEEYVESRKMILRILGPMGSAEWIDGAKGCFESAGFNLTSSSRSYRTFLLNLEPEPEEIRKNLAQKWRNCLNKAERMGHIVESSQEINVFERFAVFFDSFVQRKGFHVELDAAFYLSVQKKLPSKERFLLSTVSKDGEIIAAHMASLLGESCIYLLGASSKEGNKNNASYLLQWHTIINAQAHGMKFYDLGGIDPDANPGVYHFKKGLGGEEQAAPGSYELVPKNISGYFVEKLERAHKQARKAYQQIT